DYPDYDFMIDFPQEDYYINGSLTGLVLPVVTEASLLSSTDKNTWLPVAGDLTAGYELCIDPLVDFYYLDINTLTCSNQLATGFVDNEFYLTGTYPQSFFDYWATQGVVNGATGWQGIMWDIINGNAPMFYISWNGTDYQIIDGLQYQNFGGVNPLRVSGDYPSGVYTYKGTVKDVEGCTSEEFEVKITFNTTSTYAFEFEIPSLICTGSTVVVPVTFKSVIENQCGYDGVRFKFGATGPGDATFGATDSFNNYYEFVNDGFWGPPSGFNLPNVYNATTAWDLTFSESGSYSITFSLIEAPDGNIIAGITQTVNVSVNALPVIACPVSIEVANESGVCGKEIEFTATAIGTPTPVITYELEGSAITSPRYFEVGVHEIIAKAENDCGLVTCSFTITVEDTEAPEFTIIPEDLIVECDGEGNSDELNEWLDNVDANDNCGTVTITYDFTELSDGCGATGSAFVIWTATDAYGNTTTTSATFTIEDTTAPEFTIISQDLTVECDGSGNISDLNDWLVDVAADDVCGTVSITHNFTELSDGCGATGSAFVIWTATDACGNTTTISATFTIEDTTAPEFTIIPQDLTVECDGSGNVSDLNDWLADVAADDVCGTVSITHDFTELSDGCGATGSAFVIWTATDACGN
ncbi:MAG TPA: hypothetical protein PK908_08610, partial [Bacteroidales bacterium]|nr:hypothetical protein [Bacteroidales bacterium]